MNKECLGMLVKQDGIGVNTGFLVDMGNGRKVWVSKETLTKYEVLTTVNNKEKTNENN